MADRLDLSSPEFPEISTAEGLCAPVSPHPAGDLATALHLILETNQSCEFPDDAACRL